MPVLLAGLASSLLGCADYVAGYGSRRNEHPGAAVSIAWLASFVGVAVSSAYLLVFPPEAVTAADLGWSLAAGCFASAARPALYLAMERGPVVVASTTIGIVSLAVPAVVGAFTGATLVLLEIVGIVLAVPAVVLIVADGRLPGPAALTSSPVFPLSAATGALIGAMALCLGQVAPEAEATPALVTQTLGIVLIPLVAVRLGGRAPADAGLRRFALVVGLIDIAAIIASTIAFQRGTVAVVAAIMGFAPAVTITMAWRIDGETVRRWQWLGAGLAVGSVMLFALAA